MQEPASVGQLVPEASRLQVAEIMAVPAGIEPAPPPSEGGMISISPRNHRGRICQL
jgi:hypothetical protein